jgi:hypothetical protein
MYSPFEGWAFLDEYYAYREAHLAKILSRSHDLAVSDADSVCIEYLLREAPSTRRGHQTDLGGRSNDSPVMEKSKVELSRSPETWFTTQELVSVAVSELLLDQSHLNTLHVRFSLLDKLAQKFEVSGSLASSYKGLLTHKLGELDDMGVYQSFSLALSAAYQKSSNLQYLSTLLKLHDFLLARTTGPVTLGVPMALAVTISFEISSVKAFTGQGENPIV